MGGILPGASNPNARFSVAQVREIRALWRRGWLSAVEIAARHSCHKSAIYRLVRGETYTAPRYQQAPPQARFTKKGERHSQCKLTIAQVKKIRRLIKAGSMTLTAIGLRFGVHRSHVRRIGSGGNWRHIP